MTSYKFDKCFQIGNTIISEEHLKILNGLNNIYLQSRGIKGLACANVHLYNQTNDGDPKYALLSANEKDKSDLKHQWQISPAIQQVDTDITLDETNFKILTGEQHINLTPTNQEYNLYNTRDGDGKKRHARLDTTNYSYTGDGTYTNRSHRWTIVAVNNIDVRFSCREKVGSSLTFTTGSTLTIGETTVTLDKLNMLSESGSVILVNAGTKSHLYVNAKKDKDAKCSSKEGDKQKTGHNWTFRIPNPEEPIIDSYDFDDDVWENKDWRLIPWACEFYFDKDDPVRNIAQYSPQGISIDPFNPKTIWIMAESETCCGGVTNSNLSEFCGSLYKKKGAESSTLLFKFDFDGSKWNLDNFFELHYDDDKIYTGHGGAFFVYYNILYVGSIDTTKDNRYIRYFDLSKENNHKLTAEENKINVGQTQLSGPLYPVQTWLNFEPNDTCGGTLWASKFYSNETSSKYGAVYGVGLTIDKNTGILKLLNGTQVVKMKNTPRVAPSGDYKGTPSNQGFHYLGDNNYVSLQSFSDPPTSYDFFNTDTNDGLRQSFPPGGQAFTISEANSLGFKHDPLLWSMSESGCIRFEEKWFGKTKNFPYIYSTYLPTGFTFKSSLDRTCFPEPPPEPSNAWVKWLIISFVLICICTGLFFLLRRRRKITPVG